MHNSNAFLKSITEAKDRGENSLAQRIDAERQICEAIVTYCLKHGFTLCVYDGEDWVLKYSGNHDEIMNSLFSTDCDRLRIDKQGAYHGAFDLIYGNDGFDVVSDYFITPTTTAIWDKVISPLSDKLERQLRR